MFIARLRKYARGREPIAMCLIAFAWRAHARYRLALIANRDEFHARPTAAAGADPAAGDVYGGRDLQAGGSWLQVSQRGRVAAVTNVRDGSAAESAPRSRGHLVRDIVRATQDVQPLLVGLESQADEYGRFNLLALSGDALWFASNHPHWQRRRVLPGLHAMSNGAFDAPWPKSARAVAALGTWLDACPANGDDEDVPVSSLLAALADVTPAPDDALPDTGVGVPLERMLSPPFVTGETYGTRCSSVVLVSATTVRFFERRFAPGGSLLGDSDVVLPLGRDQT